MKTIGVLFVSLFLNSAFAQVNPAQVANNFIICSSQSQTKQFIIAMDNDTTPVMGQFIVTDAPGSQNILEMVQLDVKSASYSNQVIVVDAAGIIDFNRTINLSASAVGEFNLTPTFKTLAYIGSLNRSDAAAEGYTCFVVTADELATLSGQQ